MPEDFDEIFNQCLADIAAGRETVASCLQRYPAQAGRLAVLLELAGRLQGTSVPALPADKRRALEARVLKQAEQAQWHSVSPAVRDRGMPGWRHILRRRSAVMVFASIMAVVLLLGTTVGASAASVPGDFLYPVKRATEQVRLALTPAGQQVKLHLELARQRLHELEVLQGRGEVSGELLAEIAVETGLVLERVPALAAEQQSGVLQELAAFQDQQAKVLAVMAASAHGEAQIKVKNAQADSAAKQQKAKVLLTGSDSNVAPGRDSTPAPEPTVLHGSQQQGKPSTKPEATEKPKPQATPKATKEPPPTPQRPDPKASRTPPGPSLWFAPNDTADEHRPTREPKR
jgi:hypothetical protein